MAIYSASGNQYTKSGDIEDQFVETFANTFEEELQNEGGNLDSICQMERPNQGTRHTFFRDGKVFASKKIARKPAQSSRTERTHVQVELQDYQAQDELDRVSEMPRLSYDVSRNMASNVAKAVARMKDILKIAALVDYSNIKKDDGTALAAADFLVPGNDGEPSNPSISSGKPTFTATQATAAYSLNYQALKTANIELENRNAKGRRFVVASVNQKKHLLSDEKFINNDYANIKRLEMGEIDTWMGMHFIWLSQYDEGQEAAELVPYNDDGYGRPIITATGGTKMDIVKVFDESYLGAVMGTEYSGKMWEENSNDTLYTKAFFAFASKVKNSKRGIDILCHPTNGPKS